MYILRMKTVKEGIKNGSYSCILNGNYVQVKQGETLIARSREDKDSLMNSDFFTLVDEMKVNNRVVGQGGLEGLSSPVETKVKIKKTKVKTGEGKLRSKG